MFEGGMFDGPMFEGALDWLRDGGVNGRYPPPLPLSPGRLEADGLGADQLGLADLLVPAGPFEGVLPVLLPALPPGGVNGRKPPRFPLSAAGLILRCVCTLPGAGVRGLPLFGELFSELLGGVGGRYPPRFPFCTAMEFPALLAGWLFIPWPGAVVPALGLCIVPAAGALVPLAATRPPACTGVTWPCCMDCCKRAACC